MENCIFCKISNDEQAKKVYESEKFYAVYDINPISKGHLLIISKTHYNDFFNLPSDLFEQLSQITTKCKEILDEKYNPTGYSIISNIGKSAGQTVFHFHLHIIPRY